MVEYLKKNLGLDEVGAKNLIKASIASLFTTIAILATNIVLFVLLDDILMPILNGQSVELDITKYVLFIIGIAALLLLAVTVKYKKAYIPAYMVAAKKRVTLAEKLRKLPLSYFGKKDVADVTTTIMKDVASLEDVFSAFIPNLVSAIISTFIMCIGMMFYNWKLGLAIFWCVPVALTLTYLTKGLQTSEGKKTKVITLSYLDKLQETIENIKDIKSNNREEYHKKELFNKFEDLETALFKAEMKIGTLITSIQLTLKIGMATTVLVSANLLLNGELNIFQFILFLMVATRVYDPLQSALINLAAVFQATISIGRMKEFEEVEVQEGKEAEEFKGYDITFDKVGFRYEDKEKEESEDIIKGISFTAKQGEITALVGPSGGGKSTILKLASRFWDINSGKISIGNQDISEIDPESLLKNISIVFQDVTLFNNTVMENIRIGRKDATDKEVIEAAKKANCESFISQMPEGYNTMIGENGSKLSGGERQRLSIARALLKDSPIVFLDEATSSLDIKNETAVQEAIANLTRNKTVIVIAHRMRTIMDADKIIVLKEGSIVQEGDHEQLINVQGEYSTMVKLQLDTINWKLKV